MKQIKIGIDIHGVIDTFDYFAALSRLHMKAGHEVHIITGQKKDDATEEMLRSLGVTYSHYFSIVDFTEEKYGKDFVEWDEKGLPHVPSHVWNPTKAIYCRNNNIDILFDDSPQYAGFFNDIDTLYCQVINPNRKIYKTRD